MMHGLGVPHVPLRIAHRDFNSLAKVDAMAIIGRASSRHCACASACPPSYFRTPA